MRTISVITLTLLSLLSFSQKGETSDMSFERKSKTQEKPDLLLYYQPWCPYCQNVLSYLTKINKIIPMKNLQRDSQGRKDLISIGGKDQVPCLIIDGEALYESQDIIYWLSKHKDSLESN